MTDQLPNRAIDNDALEKETMRRVIWRILPLLVVSYLVSIIDRGNIGMAALQMNEDLGLSKAAFGFASSLYFVAYFIFEVPSNLAMQKVGGALVDPAHYDQLGSGIDVYGAGAEHHLPLHRPFFYWALPKRAFFRAWYSILPGGSRHATVRASLPLLWWPFRWLTLSAHRFQG